MPFRLPIRHGLTDADTPDPSNPPPITALSPFRYPIFRRVWSASIVSNLGGLIQSVGASWMMISLAQSADMVALVQASVTLPIMLLSLVAGAVADSLDRRKVMIAAQSFMLVASATLSICAWTGVLTPWLLLTFTFLIGCGGAFNQPAWQATVGDMVPRAELPGAVALNSMGFNLARSVGPAIGGAIVAASGAATAFAVNSVSYIALLTVLSRWRPPANPQPMPRESLGMAVTVGIRYMAMSPAIARVLLRGAVFGIGASAVMSLMPVIAKELIAGGPLTLGALLGAFGVGAVGGAVSTARLRKVWSTEVIVRSATVGFGIAAAVAALSSNLVLTMAALSLAGAGWVLALSTFNVAVQMSVPRWVLARAMSIYQMSAFGGLAAGSWLWGAGRDARGSANGAVAGGGSHPVRRTIGTLVPARPIRGAQSRSAATVAGAGDRCAGAADHRSRRRHGRIPDRRRRRAGRSSVRWRSCAASGAATARPTGGCCVISPIRRSGSSASRHRRGATTSGSPID